MNPAVEAAKETALEKLLAYVAPIGGVVATAASAVEQFAVTYGGLTIGVVGLGLNWYYNHKRLKLQEKQAQGKS